MNFLERAVYRHVRSFRREDGGLYGLYVAVYSGIYRRRILAAHRKGRHGRLMANGRCTWCGTPVRFGAARQVEWGRRYIRARYASPEAPDWYEAGGSLP